MYNTSLNNTDNNKGQFTYDDKYKYQKPCIPVEVAMPELHIYGTDYSSDDGKSNNEQEEEENEE